MYVTGLLIEINVKVSIVTKINQSNFIKKTVYEGKMKIRYLNEGFCLKFVEASR